MFLAGDREGATVLWEDLLPLIQFENRQCGLRAMKEVLHVGGVLASPRTRSPIEPIDDHTRRALLNPRAQGDPGVHVGFGDLTEWRSVSTPRVKSARQT